MKVKVTRQDIEDGRTRANSRCGCPIWQALVRKLRIQDAESSHTHLTIPYMQEAKLGRICIPLPEAAVDFQEKLINDPDAKVKAFEFETRLIAPR